MHKQNKVDGDCFSFTRQAYLFKEGIVILLSPHLTIRFFPYACFRKTDNKLIIYKLSNFVLVMGHNWSGFLFYLEMFYLEWVGLFGSYP